MKVLFINHAGVWGGASVSMEHILDALLDASHTVEVINHSVPSTTMDILQKRGFQVYPIRWGMSHPYFNGGVTNRLQLSYWSAIRNIRHAERQIERIIAQSDADVVMVNSMTLFYVGRLAKKYVKKAVCFQRETFPDTAFSQRIREKMASFFDMIVYISCFDREQFSQFPSVCKQVIYDKINISEYANALQKKSSDEGMKEILFLGGISELKGTHIAISALTQLPDFRLNIVSDKPLEPVSLRGSVTKRHIAKYRDDCCKLAAEGGVLGRIRILPPTKQIARYYAESDVVLFAPTVAHQSRLIYEAGAAHKPIVVPDMKNLDEFCYAHVFRYSASHPETCAEALLKAVAAQINYDSVQKCLLLNHDSRTLDEEIKRTLEEIEKL